MSQYTLHEKVKVICQYLNLKTKIKANSRNYTKHLENFKIFLTFLCSVDILGFDSYLLNAGSKYLAKSLSHIINLSLCLGKCPNEWKIARVCPVYKNKGSTEDLCNYRPIYVFPHVAEGLEKCVQRQL